MKLVSFPIFAGVVLAALALAACGTHGAASLPGVQEQPATASAQPRTENRPIDILVVVSPPPSHLVKVVAIGFELDGDATTFTAFDLKVTSPCTQPKPQGFECRVTLPSTAGYHRLAVTGYKDFLNDGKPAGGSLVSRNTIPVRIVNDHAEVNLAFYSITNRIWVRALESRVFGSQDSDFFVKRSPTEGTGLLSVTSLDALQRFVVGPASPAFEVTSGNAAVQLHEPFRNELVVSAPGSSAEVSSDLRLTILGKSTPACPNACKLSFRVTLSAL
jgi:hypothetical protein